MIRDNIMSQIDLPADFDFQRAGREVLDIEREGLAQLDQYINEDFTRACETIFRCTGKVVVMGMGKSGHIGRKMAATFASTGTSSFFVHPGEAAHGDLGMVTPCDVVIALSNSGESNEILALIPVLKRQQVALICITSRPESSMARAADIHLCVKVPKEACPLGLAPTSSTTAALVMGDALAVALLEARGFTAEDFALSHPWRALWAVSYCCGSMISCTPAMKFRTLAWRPRSAMRCWKSRAKI
ncbi:D-arabinose 5-phosphate isomerase [Klebsiella michiganensis]|nr:D-arabinose 5-phosphate isomerase [Klebsiella michiganensis]